MAILFKNIGLIDPDSITTFGVCAKETDNPIGYFGTGLKYAIAVLLREQQKITIYSGQNKYTFSLVDSTIRGKEFNIVAMNGDKLGFTTELGKNWEIWQAFRELFCNCLDENGICKQGHHPETLNDDETIIVCEGKQIETEFNRKHEIIITERQCDPIHKSGFSEIYYGESEWLYYRNIRCAKLPKPSLFTYNIINEQNLTEDRTFSNQSCALYSAARSILSAPIDIVETAVLAGRGAIEHDFDYQWSLQPGPEFLNAVNKLLRTSSAVLNRSAVAVFKKYTNKDVLPEPYYPTEQETQKVDEAIAFLKSWSYPVDNYEILFVETLGGRTVAEARGSKILLTREVLMMGDSTIKQTLLEEFLHIRHGFADESRELQTYLFQTLVAAMEKISYETEAKAA